MLRRLVLVALTLLGCSLLLTAGATTAQAVPTCLKTPPWTWVCVIWVTDPGDPGCGGGGGGG